MFQPNERVMRSRSFVLFGLFLLCCISSCKKSNLPSSLTDNSTFFKVYQNVLLDPNDPEVYGIYSDAASNLYIFAFDDPYAFPQTFIKTDAKGNNAEVKELPFEVNFNLNSIFNNSIYFSGNLFYLTAFDSAFNVNFISVDTGGNILTSVGVKNFLTFSNIDTIFCNFVFHTNENNFIIGGYIYTSSSVKYPFAVCVTPSGSLIWQDTTTSLTGEYLQAVETSGGNFLMVCTSDTVNTLCKVNSSGQMVLQTYLNNNTNNPQAFFKTGDNSFLLVSDYLLAKGNITCELQQLDSTANVKQTLVLPTGTTADFDVFSAIQKSNGNILIDMHTINRVGSGIPIINNPVEESIIYEVTPALTLKKTITFSQLGFSTDITGMTLTGNDHLAFTGTVQKTTNNGNQTNNFYPFILKTNSDENY
jgi:hypothetical protein